jgi:hypothetical protein
MTIPLLDHELADDEIAWMRDVHAAFAAERPAHADPREALRAVLGRPEFRLEQPIDLTGNGVWRGGRNRHGRNVAGVFLPRVELHRHPYSRTDQFAMYVRGEADAFSVDENGAAVLTPVTGGAHFHNAPGAPHAFLPKVGKPVPDDWEIAFIAITPRNLQEDTVAVADATKALYERATGRPAPIHV